MAADPFGQLIIYGVLLALCWITVSTRIFVRKFVVGEGLGSDDYLMVVSLCGLTCIVGLAMWLVHLGLGQHASNLPLGRVNMILKVFYCNEIAYFVSTVTLKLSIAIMLLRISQERIHRLIIIWTVVFYSICGVAFVFVAAFQCWPAARYWDPSIQGSCMKRSIFVGFVYTNAGISLVTDGIFAVLPTFMLWNSHLDHKTKISVSIILGLGISTAGVNIARFNFVEGLTDLNDAPFAMWPIGLTSSLEVGIGIIAASLATLRPLLRFIGTQITGRSSPFLNRKEKSITDIETARLEKASPPSPITTPQMDIDAWCEICRNSQIQAAEENLHFSGLGRRRDGSYHISQELELPAMLRYDSNETYDAFGISKAS